MWKNALGLLVMFTSSYTVTAEFFGFLRYNKIPQEIEETPPYQFGNLTFFGSGCPEGTVKTVKSSDNQTFSVIFSSYMSETSETKRMARTSCNLAVPVDVKEGFSIGIFKTDYRGFADVPDTHRKNYARFGAEYFFAGNKGPTVSKTFPSGSSEDFFISDDLVVSSAVYSACGASTVFRINTAITAYKRKNTDNDVFIGIDTIDTTIEESKNFGFHYYITQKKC